MLSEPRIYRHPPIQIILTVILFGMLAGFLVPLLRLGNFLIFLPFGFTLLLVALYLVYALTVKTIISESEISVQTLLGTKSLGWSEIHSVSGRGNRIDLHNFDGDVTVSPSPYLPGYEEIIEWIGSKRPDLFTPQEGEVMGRSWVAFLFVALLILLIVGIASFSIIQTDQWFLSIFFVLVGAAIFILAASSPLSVTIEGNSLLLKYILGQKTLRVDEIQSVELVSQRTRNGKTYHIRLDLPGGKGLRISSLRPSLPIVYLTLKNWCNKLRGSRN